MAHYLDLFSPETWNAYLRSPRNVSGFQIRHRSVAQRIKPGDVFVCYLTKLSRWCGLLEVVDGPFEDSTPIFQEDADPFIVRFHVRPVVCLTPQEAVPIKTPELWNQLSFTSGYTSGSGWATNVKGSLRTLLAIDAALLEEAIRRQTGPNAVAYPIDPDVWERVMRHTIKLPDGAAVSVSVPDDVDLEPPTGAGAEVSTTRESIQVQALLAEAGSRMGMKIWIPKADRGPVLTAWNPAAGVLLDRLPLNYDDATLKTIERIDVLWLKGRSIRRAFEVEHTTSIYSGLLRMADLMALQPNMDIALHIVAPDERRDRVLEEIARPVFSLLERGPLSQFCTYLSYTSIRQLAAKPDLDYLSDKILSQFEEEAE